jgi:osmotically-inducible protein OsmY
MGTMTSHRVHGLGCPVPSSLMSLATSGLLRLSLPAIATDASLRARVERRIALSGLQHGQVDVQVVDGHVLLEGRVASWIDRRRAHRAACRETRLVHNRLKVAPRRWR